MIGATRPDVVCVLGGARTGTHLLNSLLCRCPEVMPMLTESAPVVEALTAYRRTAGHVTQFPGMYFDSEGEVRELYAGLLGELVRHLRAKWGRPVPVFRAPTLTRRAGDLYALLQAAGLKSRIACMVRDPRDAIASMKVWERERIKRGKGPLVQGEDKLRELAKFYWSFYRPLLNDVPALPPEAIHFVRYEDLVAATDETVACLARFTGLELDAGAEAPAWHGAGVRFSPDDPHLGEAITPLYGKPVSVSSVRKWRDELDSEEAEFVVQFCRPIVARFYPGLLPR